MNSQIQPYQAPSIYTPWQVQAQWVQAAVGVIMVGLFAVYLMQQLIKVFKGEKIERPF